MQYLCIAPVFVYLLALLTLYFEIFVYCKVNGKTLIRYLYIIEFCFINIIIHKSYLLIKAKILYEKPHDDQFSVNMHVITTFKEYFEGLINQYIHNMEFKPFCDRLLNRYTCFMRF